MNDALMIGLVLTLVFGSIIFYLYNRLTMTEKKIGLFEGVLTDLKMMLDAAPFASGPPPSYMQDFEPTPEYLNAISGPVPIQQDEVEDVDAANADADAEMVQDYQQTLEQALESASATEALESKILQIDESSANLVGASSNAPVSVTKLSPDLDAMSVAELKALLRQKGLTAATGARRKDLLDILKKSSLQGPQGQQESTMLDGPAPPAEGAAFLSEPSGLVETTI
jgi:hypothetical protein